MGRFDISGTVINKYRYFPLHENSEKILGNFKEILEETERFWNNFKNILKDTGKTKKIVCDFSTNFGSTAEDITEILRKFLKFLNDFVELFRIIIILDNNVLWKLTGDCRLILQKLWINIKFYSNF